MLLILLFVHSVFIDNSEVYGQSLTNTVHRTSAAAEKVNDLFCFSCHTMDDGDSCLNITNSHNHSQHAKKCNSSEFICMVKKFSYTYSTENSTSQPKVWSLERRCAVTCESGCIVIGERTKLFACISCCQSPFCNMGNGRAYLLNISQVVFTFSVILSYIVRCQIF